MNRGSKKIIFCVTNDITPDRRMDRICRTLVDVGYEVLLVGRKLPESLPLPPLPYKTKRLPCRFRRGPLFYAEYNTRLFLYLRKQQVDIMGAVDYDTLKAVTRAASGKRGVKVVLDCHEWFEEVPELAGRDRVRNYWMRIAREGIPRAQLRYTVSRSIATKLEERYGQSFNVVRNTPVLTEDDPPSVREDIIVYLGVLNKGRGLEEMILTMRHLPAKFWLIGTGDIEEKLKQLVRQEKLDGKVIFKGFVPPQDIKALLHQCRLGINLLHGDALSYQYSLANKFFDYVHAGLPQLCMDFPEYHQLNEEHRVALLVSDLRTETLTDACLRILEDRNGWFNYHLACLEARQHWNWQREQAHLKQLFRSLEG